MKGKALVIVAISLAAFFIVGSPLSFGAEPIRIAGIFALTGRAAHIGTAQRDAVLIAIDEVNANGGINGRTLEMVMEDTESTPTKAVMALKKILESEDVVAIIGPTLTGTAMAMRGFVEEEKVPTFMHAGSDVILTIPLKKGWPVSAGELSRNAARRYGQRLVDWLFSSSQPLSRFAPRFIAPSDRYTVAGPTAWVGHDR